MGANFKRYLSLGLVTLLMATTVSFVIPSSAYADHPGACTPDEKTAGGTEKTENGVVTCTTAPTGTTTTPQSQPASVDDGTTCAIEWMGWIICPMIQTAGKVGDHAFGLLSKTFLQTEPELVKFDFAHPTGTQHAWELARNIANIMFIIAFLIIIYSQVTGSGINNYGIKRMLPRLVIAAIAVNVSYFICQAMVDLTNVLGFEIQNFLVDTAKNVSDYAVLPPANKLTDISTNSGALASIVAWILGVTVLVWVLLPIAMVGISTVVITCLVIVVILLLRKAFIVLLIVVSPIAFVMYLLPNTESFFKKWLRMFWQLLLVFPIIGLLFGGGQLASAIILASGSSGPSSPYYVSANPDGAEKCIQLPTYSSNTNASQDAKIAGCGQQSTPIMLGLVAAGIAVAPMLAVWAVLKGALSAAGSIGGKISGAVQTYGNKANSVARKPEDMAKKWAMNAGKDWAKTAGQTYAYRNGVPGARTVRNFKKRGELRKAELERAQHEFDHSGSTGILSDQIAAEKDLASAGGIAEQEEYRKKVAEGKIDLNAMAGASASDAVRSAIATQMKRATDEVIKGIKEGFQTTDVGPMGQTMREAIRGNDQIKAKAMLDMLAQSSAGVKELHAVYRDTGMSASHPMNDTLRQRVQTDNPGAKGMDASIKTWADNGGDLEGLWNNGDNWAKETDKIDKFTRLTGSAQAQAVKAMSSTAQGQAHIDFIKKELQANPSARSGMDAAVMKTLGF